MRNWNRPSGQGLANFPKSFQTTYEELKPVGSGILPALASLPDYLWGIETWFKLIYVTHGIASRLPMRNWNRTRLQVVKGQRLPDYLWGIETRIENWRLKNWRASRLPMRNWNLYVPEGPESKDNASRLPMRNWNRTAPGQEEEPGPLPDYLWGIETPLRTQTRTRCKR